MRRHVSVCLAIFIAALAAALLLWPVFSGGNAQAQAAPAAPAPSTQDILWTGVVIARNVASPKAPPAELQEFAPRLERVFGSNQFELFGSASKPIGDRTERWLVPSETFWLGVTARSANAKEARGGYLLNVQLFQNKRPLVDTEAKLAPGSPLFIRGPMYGDGQVIIVLQVKPAPMAVAGQ